MYNVITIGLLAQIFMCTVHTCTMYCMYQSGKDYHRLIGDLTDDYGLVSYIYVYSLLFGGRKI